MSSNVLKLSHIAKKFGTLPVLKDVNLEISPGQIVGLIGPSGAGKSTIIKTTLGMELADSGISTVFDVSMPNRNILSKIGYMAQTDALYKTLTGRENLQFYGQMKGLNQSEIITEIDHVTTLVNLKDDVDKRTSIYSGGMSRRLSLAIALLGQPNLLILDEPTVGIDPALRRSIWTELGHIRDNDRAILITTHVMDEAELVDKVALLLNGKIMEFDSPDGLKSKYKVDTIEEVFLKVEGV